LLICDTYELCTIFRYELFVRKNRRSMNEDYVDLHVHSTCSDGYLSPEEVVGLAAENGLRAIALADHDNIDGVVRAQQAGQLAGIEVISGVELSTQWFEFSDMHLLGYGFAICDPYLVRALEEFREFRLNRNLQIVERVNAKLVQEGRQVLDPEQVRNLAGGTIGRPHIAQALRGAGYVSGNDEAFDRYLVPCNVPKRYFPADEAIRLIHGAGGIAVLAHPPYITRNRQQLERLVADLVGYGLDGIEVYNNGSGLEDTDWLIRLARQHQLIITGGSDYHGDPGSQIQIGRGIRGFCIPYSCVDEIQAALARVAGSAR